MQKKVFFCNFKLLPLFVNFKLYSNFSKKSLFNTVLFLYIEFGSLTTSQLMEKIKGLQNLAYQLGLDEGMHCTTLSKCKNHLIITTVFTPLFNKVHLPFPHTTSFTMEVKFTVKKFLHHIF